MFSHKMKESLEGKVTIDGVAPHVFRALLFFIYTGSCGLEDLEPEADEKKEAKHSTVQKITRLLMAADRFQVDELTSLCSSRLAEYITPANATELLSRQCDHPQSLPCVWLCLSSYRTLSLISFDAIARD